MTEQEIESNTKSRYQQFRYGVGWPKSQFRIYVTQESEGGILMRLLTLGLTLAAWLGSYPVSAQQQPSANENLRSRTMNRFLDSSNFDFEKREKQRIGKWFCYTTQFAGIQKDDNGRIFTGKIEPKDSKFVITIKDADEEWRKKTCEREYGIADYLPDLESNQCLLRYRIEFSPRPSEAFNARSDNTFTFPTHFSYFALFGTGDFVSFGTSDDNSYVRHGRCEKITEGGK